mgnify:CR=1 FL=1
MANQLKDRIHTSTSTSSGDWASFRSEVTGMYITGGGTGATAVYGVGELHDSYGVEILGESVIN